MDVFRIRGHEVEYLDDCHAYVVDGVILPSVTQVIRTKFSHKYDHVSKEVLERASDKGTAVHKAIEDWCKRGIDNPDMKELRNFKVLERLYGFKVLDNEVPVVLFKDEQPIIVGRLDLVLQEGNDTLIGDIKRTSTLDRNYLAYQLNMYRIAYQQSYGKTITGLRGVHLKDDTRRYIKIPINEEMTWQLINDYLKGKED